CSPVVTKDHLFMTHLCNCFKTLHSLVLPELLPAPAWYQHYFFVETSHHLNVGHEFIETIGL
ncbi:MAG: hypothetical protein WCL28_08625, partial [bacterium]